MIQFWYSLFACTFTAGIEVVVALMTLKRKRDNPEEIIVSTEWPMVFTHWYTYLIILAAGLINVPAQNLMTLTLQYGNPSLVTIIGYCAVIYGFLADKLIFKETFIWL